MTTASLWRAFCACGLFFSALIPCSRAAAISTAAQWDATMLGYYGANFVPIKSQALLPDDDWFAWTGYMWLEAYVALAQSTGDAKYMATAKEIIDYEISNRDDIRFATTPLTPAYWCAPSFYMYHTGVPAKGWRRILSGKPEVSPLIDGRICESIVLWCEMARRGFPQYEATITSYLAKVKETLDMHLVSPAGMNVIPATQAIPTGHIYTPTLTARALKYWKDGSATFTSDTAQTWSAYMAMNHNCTFARAMMGYDNLKGTTDYRDRVQGVVNFYLNALDTARPTKAIWQYSPLDANLHNIEDVNHATVTLSLIEEAYRIGGYGVNGTHVARLVETFHTFYNTTTKGVSYFIDGSGTQEGRTAQTGSIAMKSWLWLSQFDPTIATKVRDTYTLHYTTTNGTQALAGWANLVYWDSLLAGTAAYDDTSIAATRPLYNDTVNRLLWPYCIQTTSAEVTTGSPPEGTKQTQINYTITNPALLTSVVYSFSPAENALVWGGVRLTYKTTGPAVFSLVLMDGSQNMTAILPSQSTYAPRTLRWSDFTNASGVNKAAVTKLRIISNGAVAGSTGQVFFDDVKWVP
jgi:hypothetical protein